MSKVLDEVWKAWYSRLEEKYKLDSNEENWLIELNRGVFAQVEEGLSRRGQRLRAAPSPQFHVETRQGIVHRFTMQTRKLCTLPVDVQIDLSMKSVVRDIMQLSGESPVVYVYTPVYPLGKRGLTVLQTVVV